MIKKVISILKLAENLWNNSLTKTKLLLNNLSILNFNLIRNRFYNFLMIFNYYINL